MAHNYNNNDNINNNNTNSTQLLTWTPGKPFETTLTNTDYLLTNITAYTIPVATCENTDFSLRYRTSELVSA